MSMTKSNYELVADAIYLCKVTGTNPDALREVTSALANQFQLNNNKFDRKKFLSACGLEQE